MKCRDPFVTGGVAFGCGQCIPCRVNKRRIWTNRIMLEAAQYGDNAFLTLTYSDEHVPQDGSLRPDDLRLFMYRLRKAHRPNKLRFFGVGEYGDDTERPHYHLALFNFQSCLRGVTSVRRDGSCCEVCDSVRKLWGKGNVFLGDLTFQSAAYVAGYVTKKMTAHNDARLEGRYPEFARMSLRPGIGCGFTDELASVLLEHGLDEKTDVPTSVQIGPAKWPLGRYLREQLRLRVGKEKKNEHSLEEFTLRLLPLRMAARASTENPSFKAHVVEAGKGGRIQLEAKAHRTRKRGSI